ncbi:hypothetical protein ACFWPH_23035 [Nocardia sp. NPDC058499]|uniref:hypothetical protein n=1 Tax=Nocardia sp. NPDC058499 TaxID=3346530 RepID=UPI00366989FA
MNSHIEDQPVSANPQGRCHVRRQHLRAALPLLDRDTPVDLTTLQRVAAALRAESGARHRAHPGSSADIARLRRDMGNTIADLWAALPEEVRGAH